MPRGLPDSSDNILASVVSALTLACQIGSHGPRLVVDDIGGGQLTARHTFGDDGFRIGGDQRHV